MMIRGTKKLIAEQIARPARQEPGHASATDGDAGLAHFVVETKRDNLPAVLELLRQILREPAFPPDEFDILQAGDVWPTSKQQLDRSEDAGHQPAAADRQSLSDRRRSLPAHSARGNRRGQSAEARRRQEAVSTITWLAGRRAGDRRRLRSARDAGHWCARHSPAGTPSSRTSGSPRSCFPTSRVSGKQIVTPDKANAVYAGRRSLCPERHRSRIMLRW